MLAVPDQLRVNDSDTLEALLTLSVALVLSGKLDVAADSDVLDDVVWVAEALLVPLCEPLTVCDAL